MSHLKGIFQISPVGPTKYFPVLNLSCCSHPSLALRYASHSGLHVLSLCFVFDLLSFVLVIFFSPPCTPKSATVERPRPLNKSFPCSSVSDRELERTFYYDVCSPSDPLVLHFLIFPIPLRRLCQFFFSPNIRSRLPHIDCPLVVLCPNHSPLLLPLFFLPQTVFPPFFRSPLRSTFSTFSQPSTSPLLR